MKKIFTLHFTFIMCAQTYAQENGEKVTTNTIKEVTVVGNIFPEKKKNVVQKIDVISSYEIKLMNAQNTADVLTNTGQIFVQKSQQGGGSPILRGFEANRIQLSIDGVRHNNAIFRGGHLQNIISLDNNILERVEILNGPSSTLHGSDALGGVILLKTKDPIMGKSREVGLTSVDALLRYSSANKENTASVGFGLASKKFGSLTYITYSNFDDLVQGKNGADSITKLWKKNFIVQRINGVDSMVKNSNPYKQIATAYSQLDLFQKFMYTPDKKTKHSLNIQFSNSSNIPRYDRLTETNNVGIAKNAEWYYGPQVRSLTAYTFEKVKMRGFFNDLKVVLSHQYWNESRNNRSFGKNVLNNRDEKINVLGYNIALRKKFNEHELSVGTDVQFNNLHSTAFAKNIVDGTVSKIDTRYPDGKNNMNLIGLFAQHTLKLDEGRVTINDGIRFNYSSLHSSLVDTSIQFHLPITDLKQNNTALTGNIGVAYSPLEKLRMTANFATGFRSPNFDDMTKIFESNKNQLIVPNANLKPEYSQNFEIGLQYYDGSRRLNIYGYYTSLQNYIATDYFSYNGSDSLLYNGSMTRVYASQNKAKAFIYGGGIDGSLHPTKNLLMYANINYTYGRFYTDSSVTPLDHIPPVTGKIGIRYTKNKWQTELYSLFNGKKTLNNYNLAGEDNLIYATPIGTPSWFTVNFKTSINLPQHLNLQLGVENILDKSYRYFASGMSAPGRNFVIAIRYNL
jgi:hemoglobin/transferrin/lactoferrin receptor protein